MRHLSRRNRLLAFVVVAGALVSIGVASCGNGEGRPEARSGGSAAKELEQARRVRERDQAFAAARVWTPPPVPIPKANLRDNPPGAFRADEEVTCSFEIEKAGGTTPKFFCKMANGEVLKVKYGSGNAELQSEVAATRLLAALGFASDRMYVVKAVRCAGCPAFPFQALQCLEKTDIKAVCFPGGIDKSHVATFDSAVIERRIDGDKIEGLPDQGWSWYELDKIDPSKGGSPRHEVDALRLMAVFLAHWDNKGENQRLLCPAGAKQPNGECAHPLAVIQDLGAVFGPNRVDLTNWRNFKVWKDPASCTVSMKGLPFDGATFVDWHISDAGRLHLLGLLEQLSDRQLRDLFEGSRFTAYDGVNAEGRSADAWAAAFKEKVQQIRDAGPCPKQ
jgi:hypothetical protein